jgi:hypothetical protein
METFMGINWTNHLQKQLRVQIVPLAKVAKQKAAVLKSKPVQRFFPRPTGLSFVEPPKRNIGKHSP